MRNTDAPNLKGEILELINRKRDVSFLELAQLPGFSPGDAAMFFNENLYLWGNMSQSAYDAMAELLEEKLIDWFYVNPLIYAIDGEISTLPLATAKGFKRGYKKPHWLPVVFNPIGAGHLRSHLASRV